MPPGFQVVQAVQDDVKALEEVHAKGSLLDVGLHSGVRARACRGHTTTLSLLSGWAGTHTLDSAMELGQRFLLLQHSCAQVGCDRSAVTLRRHSRDIEHARPRAAPGVQ